MLCAQRAEADALLAAAAPEVAVLAALVRVQLALAAGERGAAVELLAILPDAELQHRPAVIATLASLQACADAPVQTRLDADGPSYKQHHTLPPALRV